MFAELWARIDELVDRAPRASDLHQHRLDVFAARRYRALGLPVPPELEREEQLAAVASAAAPSLLTRVREAVAGPLLLVKGPEVAARYPDPTLRPFRDLDLVVPDAPAAQRSLLAAGFEIVEGEYEKPSLHHRAPLVSRGLPLVIELHERPKWPAGRAGPSGRELLASAVPARSLQGALTVPDAEHAVLIAVHAWAHRPLRRILDLVDVAVIAAGVDPAHTEAVAARWGVSGIWRATVAATDAVLFGKRRPWPLHLWARNLPAARERSVLESHLERLTAPFFELGPGRATHAALQTLAASARREPGQSWPQKLARTTLTARDCLTRISEHERAAEKQAAARG